MKKSNLFTFVLLCVSMIGVVAVMGLRNRVSLEKENVKEATSAPKVVVAAENTVKVPEVKSEEAPPVQTPSVQISMDDALFIGDSRTVGLMEYAQIEEADFFCTVGMSVFNIHKTPVSVPNVGKVTLTELLENKEYHKVYLMLGINEMGYKFEKILAKYQELIEFVKEKEPDANIILQANLHVTKSRSDGDKTFNNTAINRLNMALSELADNQRIFYLDANILFDDANGALSADKSSDNTHLYAKYYGEWGQWIAQQTAQLMKEE